MATDGVKIIDGDLAYDIYAIFMEMYDAGAPIEEIRLAVEVPFDEEDGFDYEIFVTVYALALWETGQLTASILQEVDEVIARGAGAKLWAEECTAKEGKKRQRELEKFREKISKPPKRIRKRRTYKRSTNFIFEENSVLTFKLPNSNYCATILIEVFQHQGKCTYNFAESTYQANSKPTIEHIESGKVIGRRMPTGFDYQLGLSIIAISPKDLRSFADRFEQIGEIELPPASKKVGTYGGARSFESFCQNWENQVLYTRNLNLSEIPLKEFL